MTLRGDPLQELLELQERMNRLFEETLGRDRMEDEPGIHGSWVPVADVFETADAYVVELELPGLTQRELSVQAHDDELVVRGERHVYPAVRPDSFHRLERRNGPFTRSFRFAEPIDAERITADLADGVLRIRVPRPPGQRPRRVPVQRDAGSA